MSDTNDEFATGTAAKGPRWRWPMERELRLWSGLVLFAFVASHLLNHALGIVNIGVMEAVQSVRMAAWQSAPGTMLLYGAFVIHAVLALRRVIRRSFTWLPVDEAVQLALGLLIPFLLIDHVVGTRIRALFGGSEAYSDVLPRIWSNSALWQVVLVLCVWTHGCIGVSQTLRSARFYARWRDVWIVFAALVPVAGLAGFVTAARDSMRMPNPAAPLDPAVAGKLMEISQTALLTITALMTASLLAIVVRAALRYRAGTVMVQYVGHGTVKGGHGRTILETSRANGVPHPAMCGGRGRCSTCRVAIKSDLASLPPIGHAERSMLQRISAPPHVRLACQLRPTADVSVQILLPALASGGRMQATDDLYRHGVERDVSVLFVDIRAFNTLIRKQLPHDLVLLLNRFIREMTQAATAHGGRVDNFVADGLMAIFGLQSPTDNGARKAVLAARGMLKAVDAMNAEFGAALPIPLRIGIGIHTGPAIVAEIGDAEHGVLMTAFGETVTIAGRLEAATKDFLVDCLISAQTMKASG
ncbi:MAG: adenylate/guanylate cyclase domain-containing protein, partial [Xanthobacteraceae bacterium]